MGKIYEKVYDASSPSGYKVIPLLNGNNYIDNVSEDFEVDDGELNLSENLSNEIINFESIGSIERLNSSSSRAYSTGEMFIIGNQIYEATTNIANGETITNAKCSIIDNTGKDKLLDELSSLKSSFANESQTLNRILGCCVPFNLGSTHPDFMYTIPNDKVALIVSGRQSSYSIYFVSSFNSDAPIKILGNDDSFSVEKQGNNTINIKCTSDVFRQGLILVAY